MLWQKEMLQLKYTFYIYAFDIGEMITFMHAALRSAGHQTMKKFCFRQKNTRLKKILIRVLSGFIKKMLMKLYIKHSDERSVVCDIFRPPFLKNTPFDHLIQQCNWNRLTA